MAVTTEPFPVDWDEWQRQWHAWLAERDFTRAHRGFPGKNFMADEKLGTFTLGGVTFELSTGTFPNLEERDERGMLRDFHRRFVGITTGVGAEAVGHPLSWTFAELEANLVAMLDGTGGCRT